MASASEPAKILVVDDNEPNRLLAKGILEDEGYRVVLACDGRDGLAAFQRESPDCAILDVRMPDMDGLALCRALRALPNGQKLPVLFLTALRDVDTFDSALAAGGDDFLTKPVRPVELATRVRTALELRRLSAELGESYELLKHQRDDLLRLQLQKERLTAFLVHDLKNPVHNLDLHAQLLLTAANLPDQLRGSVLQIRAEARQLNRMILNLLDLAKADEGKLAPSRELTPLEPLIEQLVEEQEISARLRNVRVACELELDSVRADSDLLRRALANLTENALRHAPAGSTVTISARSYQKGVLLRVADQGTGIPEALRDRIFDPFIQNEPEAQRHKTRSGRGLGLAFCRLVAEVHDGRIWIEDAEPGASPPGTAVCLLLPTVS
jgi:signal transduction histidine kinase